VVELKTKGMLTILGAASVIVDKSRV
jgi:hypothetical protein